VFAARGAYPNPSAGEARLALDLPWAAEVTVEVFDTVGRKVAVRNVTISPGHGRVVALDGLSLPTGLYLYRLRADGPDASETAAGRFTVLR
jgi:hypothetical protein